MGEDYVAILTKIQAKVFEIEKDFELVKTLKPEDGQMKVIIDHIRDYRHDLLKTHTDITEVIATVPSYTLLERVYLEFARIVCESYEEALSQIAFEILGYANGISTFKQTLVSDKINIDLSVAKMKFDVTVNKLGLLDGEIKRLVEGHVGNGTVISKEELDKVCTNIDALSSEANTSKKQLYDTFMGEMEQAQLDYKQLNIIQKTQVEMYIAVLDWLYQFNQTYKSILHKILDS